MSEISIVIPLSVFDSDVGNVGNGGSGTSLPLSPKEIVEALRNSAKAKTEIEAAQQKTETLKNLLLTSARNLRLILDEVQDPFDKAQALRQLSKEMQDIASEA